MAAGEAPVETALRKASEEAQLNLTGDRLRYIGVYSTCFATRHQPPQKNGLHSLNVTYQVELTEREQAALVLDAEEYSDWRWVKANEIASMLASSHGSSHGSSRGSNHGSDGEKDAIDQALLQVIQDLGIGSEG